MTRATSCQASSILHGSTVAQLSDDAFHGFHGGLNSLIGSARHPALSGPRLPLMMLLIQL
nr:unnamed protein product [Digitaria exilis]